jgi:Domain of unknown function (DUF4153)
MHKTLSQILYLCQRFPVPILIALIPLFTSATTFIAVPNGDSANIFFYIGIISVLSHIDAENLGFSRPKGYIITAFYAIILALIGYNAKSLQLSHFHFFLGAFLIQIVALFYKKKNPSGILGPLHNGIFEVQTRKFHPRNRSLLDVNEDFEGKIDKVCAQKDLYAGGSFWLFYMRFSGLCILYLISCFALLFIFYMMSELSHYSLMNSLMNSLVPFSIAIAITTLATLSFVPTNLNEEMPSNKIHMIFLQLMHFMIIAGIAFFGLLTSDYSHYSVLIIVSTYIWAMNSPWQNSSIALKRFIMEKFFLLLSPLMLLLGLSIWRDIKSNGVMPNNFFELTILVWAIFMLIYRIWYRTQIDIRMLIGSLGVLLFFTSAGPLGVFSVATKSQVERLTTLLETAGTLKNGKIITPASQLPREINSEVCTKLGILYRVDGLTALSSWYDEPTAKEIFKNPMPLNQIIESVKGDCYR